MNLHAEASEKEVFIEQVQLLYAQPFYRPILHIIAGVIFYLIVHDFVDQKHLIIWFIILCIVSVVRTMEMYGTKKRLDYVTDFKRTQKYHAALAGIQGLIYGLGMFIFNPILPLTQLLAILCLISTMAPAALISFSSDKLTFYCFFLTLLFPTIFQHLLTDDKIKIFIGICVLIYFLIVRLLFIWNYEKLRETIYLRLVNIDLVHSLTESNKNLEQLSTIDELTQLANRRQFDSTLTRELTRAKRTNAPLSLIIVDIDHFKQYNDTYGHVKGDECLQLIAKTIQERTQRPGDLVARYGGEEICIILPETNTDGALNFANTIHTAILDLKIDHAKSKVNPYVTASMGVATLNTGSDMSEKDLITEADKALYEAKGTGRNKIYVAKTNNC